MLKKLITAGLLVTTAFGVAPLVIDCPVVYAKTDKKDKTKAQGLYSVGVECMKNGKFKDAAASFMEASEADKENPIYAMFTGDMLLKLKQYPAAIRSYTQAIENYSHGERKQKDKIRMKSYLGISDAYRKSKDLTNAEIYARDLIAMYPEDYRGYLALGRVYSEDSANWSKAIIELSESIVRKPDQIHAYLALAKIYSKQNDIQKVIETYEMACDYRPLDEGIKMSLAQVYFTYTEDGSHYKDAIRVLKSILDVNENNALARYYLALAYTLDDDLESAEKELGVLTGLNQNLAERLYQEIKAYNRKRAQGNVDVSIRPAKDGEIITLEEKERETVSQVIERQLEKLEKNS